MIKFPQRERSFSVYEIETLFAKGKHRVEGSLKMVIKIERAPQTFSSDKTPSSEPAIKALFSVPKRAFKRANKRNLLRRRMKEAYRLNKGPLVELLKEENLRIAWIYLGKEIVIYQEIHESMFKHIQWLIKHLQKRASSVDSASNKGV